MKMGAIEPSADPTAAASAAAATPWYAGLATGLVSIVQQDRINKINLQRAQAGLPALEQSALAPTMNVGLPPDQLKKILMFGGLGLAAILSVALIMGRKR